MQNPFLKLVMKDKKGDVVHSSAYGEVQNGGWYRGGVDTEFYGADEDRAKSEASTGL